MFAAPTAPGNYLHSTEHTIWLIWYNERTARVVCANVLYFPNVSRTSPSAIAPSRRTATRVDTRDRVECATRKTSFFRSSLFCDVTQFRPLCNITEERRSHLNHGGSLKSCTFFFQTCHAFIGVVLTKRSVCCMTLNCWELTSTLLQDVSMGNNIAVVLLQNC